MSLLTPKTQRKNPEHYSPVVRGHPGLSIRKEQEHWVLHRPTTLGDLKQQSYCMGLNALDYCAAI